MEELLFTILGLVAATLHLDVAAALLPHVDLAYAAVLRVGRVGLRLAAALPELTQQGRTALALAPVPGSAPGSVLLFQADGGALGGVIDQVTGIVKPIGQGLAILGITLWGLSKLASPILPEWAAQNQGYFNKAFLGMLAVGMAGTIVPILMGIGGE